MRNLLVAAGAVIALSMTAAAAGPREQAATQKLNQQQLEAARAGTPFQTPLDRLNGTPGKVANASVYDGAGHPVGAVQRVELRGGVPVRVEIALLGSGSMVKVPAAQFTYAPADNSLTLHADTGALAAQAQAQ